MITFFAGLFILLIGGVFYSRRVERIFAPDDRPTPAYTMENGVDFVPMDEGRNALIQFLNIAGTEPILGPILGILFGPVVCRPCMRHGLSEKTERLGIICFRHKKWGER